MNYFLAATRALFHAGPTKETPFCLAFLTGGHILQDSA